MVSKKIGVLSMLLKGAGASLLFGTAAVSVDFYRRKKSDSHTIRTAFGQYVSLLFLQILGAYSRWKLESDSRQVKKVQDEKLLDLLRSSSETLYGKEHGFGNINTREEYVLSHPLTRYDHYKPYIERLLKGDVNNILTKDKPIILAVTSGTNGQNKLLPMVQAQRLAFLSQGVALAFDSMYKSFPQAKNLQKCLKFFYSPKMKVSEGGTPIGPNSSSPGNSKALLDSYSTPLPGFDILTEPEACYVHFLFGLKDRNLGMLEANFASLVFSAFRDLENNWEKIVEDIEMGRIHPGLKIDFRVREAINQILQPDPKRASELREEFKKGFEGIAKRVWPNLNLALTVDSGAFKIYGRMLEKKYLKGVPIYSPLYGATEGLIGVNIWPMSEERHYVLSPRSMVWEFIPIDKSDEDQPKTMFADQVGKGQTYELVITNISGLYRYRFGDVVRVVDFYNQCPVVEFLYRQGQLLNVRGEKVSEDVLEQAVKNTLSEWSDVNISDFTTVESPMMAEKADSQTFPHYVIFMEPQRGGGTSSAILSVDKTKLDENLKNKSYVYSSFRQKGSIAAAEVKFVQPGTFKKLREYHLTKTDASPNNWKTPRVLKRKEAVDILLDNVLPP